MRVALIFTSKSEEFVYKPLKEFLEKDHEVLFEVISALKEPDRLREFLQKEKYDVVVAGSGLAALLPGIAASITSKPVFGVPVETCYGGLDALLSMQQMPYGTPVLTSVPYNQSADHPLFHFLAEIPKRKDYLVTLSSSESARTYEYLSLEYKKLKELAEEKELAIEEHSPLEGLEKTKGFVINLVHSEERISHLPHVINVPVFEKHMLREPSRALSVFQWVSSGGMWVGMNSSQNALLFTEKLREI